MMTAKELKAFTDSVNANRAELAARFLYLDLCTEAEKEQGRRFDAIYERVLQAGDFRANREGYEPQWEGDPQPGDRVTENKWMFLLTDEDFHKVLELATPMMVAEGLTDENGNYVTNWMRLRLESERSVNEFFIRKIIPEQLQSIFWDNRRRVVVMQKMRAIARQMVEA